MTDPIKESIELLLRRNVSRSRHNDSNDAIEDLLRLTHVRLDRENLHAVPKLDFLPMLTNLYLQHNDIEELESLSELTNLQFLTLACNRISRIQNIKTLTKLQLLDVSNNAIETLDFAEIPKNLCILNFSDNPCMQKREYLQLAESILTNLKVLNGIEIEQSESSSEESSSDEEGPAKQIGTVEGVADAAAHRGTETDEFLQSLQENISHAVTGLSSALEQVKVKLDSENEFYEILQTETDIVPEMRFDAPDDTAVLDKEDFAPAPKPAPSRTNSGKMTMGVNRTTPRAPVTPPSANFRARRRTPSKTKERAIQTRIRTPGALPFRRAVE